MFRKNPAPWYDATAARAIGAMLMVVICFFGAIGIRVAATQAPYARFIWLPVLLTVLSGGVLVSLSVRLIRRKDHR